MTRLEDELAEGWATLSPEQAGPGIETRQIGIELDGGGVRVGLDAYGARHLLVPLYQGAVASDRRSGGVVLVGQELHVEGRARLFADLVCVRPELNDVFAALAADVCESLSKRSDQPTKTILRALERWRQLLGPSGRSGDFTMSTVIGLHGELLVLERAIEAGGPSALDAWTGPERLHHDFRLASLAVEVKTTTAREGVRVEIHGLEQLDSSADVELAFIVLRLILDPAGNTLPEVVHRVLGLVDDEALLLERLRACGYLHGETPPPEQAPDWPRYLEADVLAWWVGEDFPAIRRVHLPEGAPAAIEGLRYTINLAAAGPPMSEEELESTLAALGGRA